MNRFTFINAYTAGAALDALKSDDAITVENLNRKRPLGGGSDLLAEIKEGLIAPDVVVNLKGIGGWNGITFDSRELRIGATTTIAEIADAAEIHQKFAALAQAAHHVGSAQIRNVATVGGNLCQRPRCWYFRNPDIACLKKGGEGCPASVGENKYHSIFHNDAPCHIVSPSNLGVALLALDGKVNVTSPQGDRAVAAADFFRLPTREDPFRETTLRPGELVTGLSVPITESKSAYLQFSEKAEFDWALVSAAVSLQMSGSNITSIRLALGAVAQVPWRLPAVEKYLMGKSATDETVLSKAADLAVAEAQPLGKNAYKVTIAKTAVKRVIRQALGIEV